MNQSFGRLDVFRERLATSFGRASDDMPALPVLALQAHLLSHYEDFVGLIEDMVGAGVLNRADDAIPTREELLASPHRERGLPRPLLAVLLGHTKLWAEELILETDFPDGEAGRPLLDAYFPKRLREGFSQYFGEHYLRREIIGTAAINHIVNNAGISYLARTMAATKAGLIWTIT